MAGEPGFFRWVSSDGTVVAQIHPQPGGVVVYDFGVDRGPHSQGHGVRALRELKERFGPVTVMDPVPGSVGFWDKMKDRGFVDRVEGFSRNPEEDLRELERRWAASPQEIAVLWSRAHGGGLALANPPAGDERTRRLERAAASGDLDALVALGHARSRIGLCADCGITLPTAPPPGGFAVPVATSADGRRRCIACAAELDLVLVNANRPVSGYLSVWGDEEEGWPRTLGAGAIITGARATWGARNLAITNFMGFPLLAVRLAHEGQAGYTGSSVFYQAFDTSGDGWYGRARQVGYVTTARRSKTVSEGPQGQRALNAAQDEWIRLAREDPTGASVDEWRTRRLGHRLLPTQDPPHRCPSEGRCLECDPDLLGIDMDEYEEGHPEDPIPFLNNPPRIDPGLTAIRRGGPSVPIRELAEAGVLEGRILDFGCGQGEDADWLESLGLDVSRYDPAWTDPLPRGKFDVVTALYVVNVIPGRRARSKALRTAWGRVRRGGLLAVAARTPGAVASAARKGAYEACHDGWCSSKGTFQRGFDRRGLEELLARLPGAEVVGSVGGVVLARKATA